MRYSASEEWKEDRPRVRENLGSSIAGIEYLVLVWILHIKRIMWGIVGNCGIVLITSGG